MSGKKKKTNFNVKKAKEYYSGTEHSYPQDSSRLSKRGIRSEMGSQINDSFGKLTAFFLLSKLNGTLSTYIVFDEIYKSLKLELLHPE